MTLQELDDTKKLAIQLINSGNWYLDGAGIKTLNLSASDMGILVKGFGLSIPSESNFSYRLYFECDGIRFRIFVGSVQRFGRRRYLEVIE